MDLDENVVYLSLGLCAELCFNVLPVFTWIYAFSSMYVWREGTETEKKIHKRNTSAATYSHIRTKLFFFCLRNEFLLRKKKFFFLYESLPLPPNPVRKRLEHGL